MSAALVVTPVTGMPEVRRGDDLAALICDGLRRCAIDLLDGDILVVSSKVVSKAAGLTAPAAGEHERQRAIAGESRRVVAERISTTGLTQVVQSAAGPVMAAAGVDASNTGAENVLLLLPHDPDAAAASLRLGVLARWPGRRTAVGVVISDTAGRPWRVGQVDFALGASGVRVTEDLKGAADADGRPLQVTERCLADEMAAAADLVKGKSAGVPVAHLRGLGAAVFAGSAAERPAGASALVRTGASDWFGLGRAEAVRTALGVVPGSPLSARVGVASTGAEPVERRVHRAVAVAMVGVQGATAEVGTVVVVAAEAAIEVRLDAQDPYVMGFVAARVLVALAGEGLGGSVAVGSAAPPAAVVRILFGPPTAGRPGR